ncbi:alanine--glyoxylate aminotransferase 1 [Trichomonascus vanleenenianus]|uniref:alanine--glyoxylate transaminase n=1 Tax=Trichomonascus vanleenenianus TaxID=2268995 RepID=UPI003ECBA30C
MSTQKPHALTMIPGPIEFDDRVLEAMAHPAEAHTAAPFLKTFSSVLKMTRQLFLSTDPNSQAFIVAGSGSLGWDMVASNLLEHGENALVLNTGYFSAAFADCLTAYGAKVDQLSAPVGDRPTLEQIEQALKQKNYKVITITHVDTSTGVLSDIRAISELVHRVSPDTLVIVDGVCSVASEVIRFDEWGLDFVLTGSQKAIGAPPGLSITYASGRALKVVASRKTPVPTYFASLPRWLPIMQAYEAGKPAYFATPPVQNIYALHEALSQFATSTESVETRFKVHEQVSNKVKDVVASYGLKTVAVSRDKSAHGLTCVYLPEGVANTDLLPSMLKKNIVIAGGIHKEIAPKYFRIGHMGVSATRPELGHIDTVLNALKQSLSECGYNA